MKRIMLVSAVLTARAFCLAGDIHVSVGDWAVGGTCLVRCTNQGDWRLSAEALPSGTNGISLVHVLLESGQSAKRPVFSVKVRIPGGEARSLWRPDSGCRKFSRAGVMPFVSHATFASCAAQWMPLYAFLDAEDKSVLTLASSESCDRVVFRGGTEEGPNTLVAEYKFNTMDCETPTNRFEVTVRFDVRRLAADRALPVAAAWMRAADSAKDHPVPDFAFEPVWSSWCAYHTSVTEEIVEREAAAARSVGLNAIILDDGWQVPNGMPYCDGDNLPSARYAKDFAAHVSRLHEAGTKVVLWYPVTLVTDNAPNIADYEGTTLYRRSWGPRVWDPRFPARRAFFHGRIATAMKDWKVDGLKLDFVDSWGLDFDTCKLPDVSNGIGNRDVRDLMPAVAKTMAEAREIVSDIRPDAIIEFRQGYIGPRMLKCCTQMRVQDCPGSLAEMRYGIANLRLTCGPNAVHSDPIQWSRDASATSVAESILSSIFGIGQYSVRLTEASPEQLKILKHWVAFAREHSAALYHGDFRVQGLSSDAPVLVGETASERIVGAYKPGFVADCGMPDRRIVVLNGTGATRVTVRFGAAVKGSVFGPDGMRLNDLSIPAGLSEIELPRGGYLSVADDNLTAYSMVTRDGRRLVSRVENGKTVYELIATNSLPAGLPPVRQWTIYGIKSAHSDLGLHRSNYEQRKGTVRRLEMAKELFDADRRKDADPAAFRYVQEGWWGWFNFLADRGEEKSYANFVDLIRRGRFDIGLSLCGSTTHIFGYEELARSIYPLRELRTKWGVAGHTSQLVDNPGVSCAVIDPYVEAGIENLTFWPNGWVLEQLNSGRSPHRTKIRFAPGTDHPPVFWWEAPSGNRLLVWSGSHYIGGGAFGLATAFIDKLSHPQPEKAELPAPNWQLDLERMERATAGTLAYLERAVPYDVWLFPDYHDDELPSTRLADAFAKWNEKWATPIFHTVGRLDEPFERLRANFSADIPVVRGDISCAWDRTLPAAAELVADKLAADRLLPLAEARATVAAVKDGTAYPHDDLAHGYEALLLNDDHSYGFSGYSGRRCYDTWMQHRDWIETAERIASNDNSTRSTRSARLTPVANGESENRWYRIEVNERGEITSIYDKELKRELLDGVANRLLYTRDGYRTWSDPETLGGNIVQKVSLDPNEKRIVIENTILDAADLWNTNRFYRYGHYVFPFKVENPRFYSQLNGPVVDAHAGVTPHVQDTFACIRDWCAVENGAFGVALVQPDTCIVEYGELHTTNAYCRLGRPTSGHVYPHVFADGLQYQLDRPPSCRFRFILTSYAGTWQDAHIPAFAARQVGALAADREIAALVSADQPNVELTALKRAEDGCGLIVRFRETEGRVTDSTVTVGRDFVKNARLARVTVIETPWEGEDVRDWRVKLRPFETVTLRVIGDLPVLKAAPSKEPWTGLLVRPRVFPGGKGGTTYLLWGTDDADDFDHYEISRDGRPLATVTNIVDEGVLYRNARYEDAEAEPNSRHDYKVRSVYEDGRKGAWVDFTGLTQHRDDDGARSVKCECEFGELDVSGAGAQTWSWKPSVAKGAEMFFMPENVQWGKEVHGGLPICWPWFGAPPEKGLPKHGIARYATWKFKKRDGDNGLVFELFPSAATRQIWPHDFRLELALKLEAGDRLSVRLVETNTSKEPFESAWGFHPYFRVTDAERVVVDGEKLPPPSVRVQSSAAEKGHRRTLTDIVNGRKITVECADNEDWFVWNPGVERTLLCETLGPDEWRRFYCLEPFVEKPKPLAPGESRVHEMVIKVCGVNAEPVL